MAAAVRRRAAEHGPTCSSLAGNLQSNDISLRNLSDQQLPALDLTASYGLAGVGGTQFIRQGSGLGSTVIDTIPERLRRRAGDPRQSGRADLELRQ